MSKLMLLVFVSVLATIASLSLPVRAQTPPVLSGTEKEYFDKGLAAAKRQAWEEALLALSKANQFEIQKKYPPVYFNLGIVFRNLNAPLHAAACFQAYLALAPNAANASTVRQEIAALEKMSAAQIDAIFRQAAELVATIDSNSARFELARYNAQAGRISQAVDLIRLLKPDSSTPIGRAPDLHTPDPWINYAAALLAGEVDPYRFLKRQFGEVDFGAPKETRLFLERLERVFPIPAPINNPDDGVAAHIDSIFAERSTAIATLKEQVAKALSKSQSDSDAGASVSVETRRQVAFADRLLWHSTGGNVSDHLTRPAFDLQAALSYPKAPVSKYAEVGQRGKVAADFGADAFIFSLLRGGAAAATLATEGPEVEEALWKSIADAKDPQRFLGYLAWFPKGKYAELADLNARQLQAEARLAPSGPTPETVPIEEAVRRGKAALESQNPTEAARWYRSAAERGDVHAQMQMAFMYENGHGVPEDGAQAIEWYRKAAAQGDRDAGFWIAYLYKDGHGTPKNMEEAVRWYKWAAEKGDSRAYASLGEYYMDTGNYPEAISCFRKAAGENARGQFYLGEMYEKGLGVPRNLNKAAYWYRLAANSKEDPIYGSYGMEALERIGNPTPDPGP